ncbi:hypothetical protein FRB90_009672, partial [Tulasnella sp. 427]
ETIKTTLSKRNEFVKYGKMAHMRGKGDLWHYDPTRIPGLKSELRKKGLLKPKARASEKRGSPSAAAPGHVPPSTSRSLRATEVPAEHRSSEQPESSVPSRPRKPSLGLTHSTIPFSPYGSSQLHSSANADVPAALYIDTGRAISAPWSPWNSGPSVPEGNGAGSSGYYMQPTAHPTFLVNQPPSAQFAIYPPYNFGQ